MENIIANAVNHFRSNKQNLAYEKAKAKKQPAEPFSGISLQSTNEKVYFANPYQSAAALAPPMFSTPISFSSNFDTTGNVPIVETQKYVEEVEEQNIETDIMAAQQATDPDAEQSEEESEDESDGQSEDESEDESDGQSDATQPLYDSEDSYDSDEHELNERKLDELNQRKSDEVSLEGVPLPPDSRKRTIEDDVDDNKRSRYDSPEESEDEEEEESEDEEEDEDEEEEQTKPPQPPPPPARKVATIEPVKEEQLNQPFNLKDALDKKFKSIRPDSDDSSDEEREFDGFGRGGAKRTVIDLTGDSDDEEQERHRRLREENNRLLREREVRREEERRRREENQREIERTEAEVRRLLNLLAVDSEDGVTDNETDDEGGARTFPGGKPGAFKKYREALKKGDEALADAIKADAKTGKRKFYQESKKALTKTQALAMKRFNAAAAKAEKEAKKAAAKAEKEAKKAAEKAEKDAKKAAAKAEKERAKFAAQFNKKTRGRGGACNRCKYGSLQDIADKLGCT